MKKLKIALVILIIIAIVGLGVCVNLYNSEVKSITSEQQLLNIKHTGAVSSEFEEKLKSLALFQAEKLYESDYNFSFLDRIIYRNHGYDEDLGFSERPIYRSRTDTVLDDITVSPDEGSSSSKTSVGSAVNSFLSADSLKSTGTKDYSTTNIQVENVDEADINKTDGDYIYSISEYSVVITDVRDPKNIKIASKINKSSINLIPEDLMLSNNKLVVIFAKQLLGGNYDENTVVKTYDISSKESPKEIKSFEIHQKYYTSRCIDDKLYVISSGSLRYDRESDEDKIDRSYSEDGEQKKISLKDIKYLKNAPSSVQTIITTENLDDVEKEIKISSFLMDVSNAYVSEKSIYLLDEKYEETDLKENELLKDLFSLGGIYAFRDEYQKGSSSTRKLYTHIYKFDIEKNGEVKYKAKTRVDGKTINQYSLDETEGHLRIATYEFSKGAKITIFNENLKEIGHSERVGENENMYSTRFMGNRAYLVTYQTVDPLFVIDLSDEAHPKVLGELSIPGYSMYLHPYDDDHIIGIGMETKETVTKDSNGRVKYKTARIVGMKMALFDVSDVRNPKQISQVVIGDSRTTSSILTNPKALLFSKEKELIAIPVNSYNNDFEITNGETYEETINSYTSSSKSYISEGYCVYKINVDDGFQYKGTITHENSSYKSNYYSKTNSKLLRGLYIEDNLYTVSETKIKVNNLETMDLVSELKIK